jgi:hypothetical protein
VNFGPLGDFALIEQPRDGTQNYLIAMRDEALFMTTFDPWRASEVITARMAAWKSSPWVRIPLRLNGIEEARKRYRAICESAWETAESHRAGSGTLTRDGGFVPDKRSHPYRSGRRRDGVGNGLLKTALNSKFE